MTLKCKVLFIFILVGLLLTSGCNLFKQYEIEGTWTIIKTVNGEEISFTALFNGYREYGEVIVDEYGDGGYALGSYEMEYDTDLGFSISYFKAGAANSNTRDFFSGGFDDHDTMSGILDGFDEGVPVSGTWIAYREEPTL
jgi:hypothetical protein